MVEQSNKTDSIFWSALGIAALDERDRYLSQACADDLKLRAQLDELLAAYPKVERFLEQPAYAADPTANHEPPVTEKPGTVIGPYKLLQQIGEGGMGAVFMAEQTQPVQRLVALKIIKPGMDTRQVIARFEAERQALALMDHPNIARVLDAGATETGRPYFVMELVKGIPLTQYCDENRLTPRQRLELFIPVCHAVQHAHQKGVIHRDLKPSNVMIALYDGHPVPKVIDFGVAKATGQKLTEQTLFTQFGQIVGTLEYMSPEQAVLNQIDIDTRSDIYSLGVLLYELLTGTTPFESNRLRHTAFDEMLRIIREEDPPTPSARLSTTEQLASIASNRGLESKKLSGFVRGDLDWVVMKALEKDRARRYDTASSLAADVACFLSDQPVLAARPSAMHRARKFIRRNRLRVAAVLIVLLTLVAGITATMIELVRAANAERVVLEQRNTVTAERDRANSALGLLATEQEKVRDALAEKSAALGRATSAVSLLETEQARVRDALTQKSAALEREKYGGYGHALYLAYRDWLEGDRAQAENRLNGIDSDLRHWEWYYLKHLCGPISLSSTRSAMKFAGARLPMIADGKTIIDFVTASGTEAKLNVLDVSTGAIDRTLTNISRMPRTFAAGGDGVVITAEWQAIESHSSLSVLSGENGETILNIELPDFLVENLATCSEGRLYAASGWNLAPKGSGTRKPEVRVWKDALSDSATILRDRTGSICSLVFSPDGSRLLTSGASGFTLWETDGWTEVLTDGRQSPSPDLQRFGVMPCFTRDRSLFAHAARNDEIMVRDAATGGRVRSYVARYPDVSALAYGNHDRTLAYGTVHGNVVLLDLETGKQTIKLRIPTAVIALEFSADGSRLVTMRAVQGDDQRGQLEIWDAAVDAQYDAIPGSSKDLHTAAISPDGRLVASAGERSTVCVWEAGSRTLKQELNGNAGRAYEVAFSQDGTQIAAAGPAGISVWSLETGAQLHAFPGSAHRVSFANDGNWLLGVHTYGVTVWDLTSGEEVRRYKTADGKGITHSAVLTADTRRLVSCGQSGLLHLWDTATGSEVYSVGQTPPKASPDEKQGQVRGNRPIISIWDKSQYTTVFSPDEKRIAVCGGYAKIPIYSAETGDELMALSGHIGGANTVAYSNDGKRVVSAGRRDGSIKIWDAASGTELLSLTHPGGNAYSAVFSVDGRRIVTSGSDGILRIWDAGVSPIEAQAKADAP